MLVVINKLFSIHFIFYFLIINFFIIYYLFFISTNNFFKIIIMFLFLVNSALLLSYFNADFFSAFLLAAELPILLVLIIFYFQKNNLQLDNFFKYKNNIHTYKLYALIFIFFSIYLISNSNAVSTNYFLFYNFIVNDSFLLANRNDFSSIYLVYYKLSHSFVYIFGYLIFFLSLLVILIFQLNKFYSLKFNGNYKNMLILRKQSTAKQSVYTSKLKFFNKKII
jgi:hypothetical protein